MKHLLSLILPFITFGASIHDVRSAELDAIDTEAQAKSKSSIIRAEVKDISALQTHAESTDSKVFFIDADEVLFTSAVDKSGKVSYVRLYDHLETLLSQMRQNGHRVFIMTYNTADEIRRKLAAVGLAENYFDGILSCEMQGDVMTAKGDLLKRFVEQNGPVPVAVFIDNFPPFVKNVEQVASELGITLYSYLSTGYIDFYHAYVYHHLQEIQAGLKEGKDVTAKVDRIQESLKKYKIDLSSFKDAFPTYESFKAWADENKLIWPYLTYL